jgi:hypothetical protein
MDQAEIAKKIHERYPDVEAVFRQVPELWNILVWSIAMTGGASAGLSQTQFEAAVKNTNWYKHSTEAGRDWFKLRIENPGEAVRRQQNAQHDVLLAGIQMGSNLSMQQVGYIADRWLQNGWSTAEMRDQLVGYTMNLPEAKRSPGAFGAAMTKVRSVADEYGMAVSDKEAAGFAQQLLFQGTRGDTPGRGEGDIRDVFAKRAKSLFPSLREELEAGTTVKQWASPFIQLAAQELEVSPDAVTFNDPKWRAMLEGQTVKNKDGSTGTKALTLSEWQAKIRQEPRYGYDRTTGAREQAAQMETELLTRFGGI